MASVLQKWTNQEYAMAMATAISQNANNRLLRKDGDKFKFNGFWRNGNKQNVCAWVDKATWHDAKTGQGGGCKEFAKIAFNMDLAEFMVRFGPPSIQSSRIDIAQAFAGAPKKILLNKKVEDIFNKLLEKDKDRNDKAKTWLENERGIIDPRSCIGSGFANLTKEDIDLFEPKHRGFIRERLSISDQLVVPLRSATSIEVKNLFFRSISPQVTKEEKSRILPCAGGWSEEDSTLRAFGFPHLIDEFPNLLLCEGMADYFAAEQLLDCDHKFLPIGVGSAAALPKWSQWLAEKKFTGCVIIAFHLDSDKNGRLSDTGVGQENAIKCANTLLHAGIKARLFPWLKFIKLLNDFIKVRDLADSLVLGLSANYVTEIFLMILQRELHAN